MPTSNDAANQYQAYAKGWVAGAAVRAMDPAATGHTDPLIRDAYNLGYKDGQDARRADLEYAGKRYGYEPSILRLCET
jgi:hypothetical protein